MSSSSYLELLKLKQAKLLKVIDSFEGGVGRRSDFGSKILCGSDNVPFKPFKETVLKLPFILEVKIECPNKALIRLKDLFRKYLFCSTPDCGYKCRFSSHMARHELLHNSGEKLFKCRDCKYFTNRKDIFQEHQVRIHSNNTGCKKVFVCEFEGCNFRTTLKSRAVEHRRRHQKTKPFKCHHPDCGLSFVTQRFLRKHKIVHSERKRFKCMQNNCNYATKRRYSLKLHQATHSSVRAFKCPHENCNYAAKQSGGLRQHLLTHSKAKPYKCDFKHCNYAARSRQRLRLHHSVHSEFRPFKCDLKSCSYAAKQKTTLVRHKRRHERRSSEKGKK